LAYAPSPVSNIATKETQAQQKSVSQVQVESEKESEKEEEEEELLSKKKIVSKKGQISNHDTIQEKEQNRNEYILVSEDDEQPQEKSHQNQKKNKESFSKKQSDLENIPELDVTGYVTWSQLEQPFNLHLTGIYKFEFFFNT
jgi:hypothetical protein